MSEVSSQTRCPHELPVYHAAGRGKSRWHVEHARAPGAGSDLAAGCMLNLESSAHSWLYPDQPVNSVDFLVPAAL